MAKPCNRYASVEQLLLNSLAAFLLFFALSACSLSPNSQTWQSKAADAIAQPSGLQNSASLSLDQNQILQAQASGLSKVEVLFAAQVKKLLPDDTRGLPHQKFLLQLTNGSTILVAHDTKYAPKVPIQPGDTVIIQGEYIWNKKGGLVHWTHHSDTPRHMSGYIEFAGKRYQ